LDSGREEEGERRREGEGYVGIHKFGGAGGHEGL